MLLALRVNVLAKGHSGISPDTLQQALGEPQRHALRARVPG